MAVDEATGEEPANWAVTQRKTYEGPGKWSAPKLIADAAPLLKVELIRCAASINRLGTKTTLEVEARGKVKDVRRFFLRADDIAGAHDRGDSGPAKSFFGELVGSIFRG